jgi:hypothetical protein
MDDINSWKKHKDDPPPAEYDYYPKTNYKSLAYSELSNDYEYYEKYSVFIALIIVSNIFFIIVKERPLIKLLSTFLYNSISIFGIQKILKYYYKYDSSQKRGKEYPMKLFGYGFQKYISTPNIFKGPLKDEYFPQHKMFNENYEIIKDEVNGLLKYRKNIPDIRDALPIDDYVSRDHNKETGEGWKFVPLKIEGKMTEIGKLHCPKLSSLVDIPIIRNVTVSILDGKRHIPIHRGYFKGYIRYLFCVIEPKTNHSFIYINKDKYIFKENEGILWDDIFPHEVYNMADEPRVCIFIDVLRKLDNKVLDFLFKNLIKLTKYSKEVSRMNATYEKKPIALDDFPKLKRN